MCLLLCRQLNVPVRIAIGQTGAYCAANPVLAEAVRRLDAKEAAAVIQVMGDDLLHLSTFPLRKCTVRCIGT